MTNWLRAFARDYPVKQFAKGEVILCEGDVPPCAYIIKSGVVKGYALTAEGLEKPISFDTEIQAFPLGWIFSKLKFSQYYYSAFTDSQLYCVPQADYLAYLEAHPKRMVELYGQLLDHYLSFQMRVNALEQSRATDKIIHTFHFLSLRYGRDTAPHVVRIDLPLTQQDLANIMGITRETTGIELKKLEKAKVLSYRRQKYIVHTDRLNELLDEEYGSARIMDHR